ncbi:hypothetical protein O1L55_13455 [Streptomyces albulus]|nr:hypothetical protein [Streptomyces noursei]
MAALQAGLVAADHHHGVLGAGRHRQADRPQQQVGELPRPLQPRTTAVA